MKESYYINKQCLTKTNSSYRHKVTNRNNESPNENCYYTSDNNIKMIHIIITRFGYYEKNIFKNKTYKKEYIINGIRVMKKYLFPSLENQSCKEFIWILMLGDTANITTIKFLLNLNLSFESKIIYQKYIKNYLRNISKGFDVLITTRIDYDDRIYYDAVNDVRKAVNINKPMILYGYNRGAHYYELENKYYEFYSNFNNKGTMNIFCSLIIVLNKVNDTYTIYDMGYHFNIRKKIFDKFKSFGIKKLNYEPAIFDSGDPKFVWVRQRFSGLINKSYNVRKKLKLYDINLKNFYKEKN